MSKKQTASAKMLTGDPRFNSRLVAKFVNCIMHDGKKATAFRIFYDAMDIVVKKAKGKEPLEVFEAAVNNVRPQVEVRSKRVGGATYQVPMEVPSKRAQSLAFRWILLAARGRKGKPMCDRLADELVAAFNKEGAAITTRDNTHKMAEANKAFAHFAWR
jgi:small subunit ribosomal protein S7